MRIGEVAGRAGVSVDTVRFYERVGVLPPAPRTESGYRDYEPGTIERIRLTRQLQAIGFTLDDTVDALAARVDAKIAELSALRGRIVQTQQACASGQCVLVSATPQAGGQAKLRHTSAQPG